jgi:hypothetical protein
MAQADPADTDGASKDRFYERLSALAEEMITAHGREFTMGSLILAARYIAEHKGERGAGAKSS